MAFSEIAFKALQDVVGEGNVTTDPVVCQSYSRVQWTADGCVQRSQLGVGMRPDCVVLPRSTEEVQSIIKLANRYDFVFIPRGTGMINSALPNPTQRAMGKGIVIIDPKHMDKILKIDKNNMYMVIEPYVNFAACQAEAMKVGCTVAIAPAGAQISALANIQWHGAYGNSWVSGLGSNQLLSFEVVLPTGEILRSGNIAQEGAEEDWVWNDGPGPDLRGFFRGAQFGHAGGMGMVTKISMRLFPWPGPSVFPTQGDAVEKESHLPKDKVRWYMIDFPRTCRHILSSKRSSCAGPVICSMKSPVPSWQLSCSTTPSSLCGPGPPAVKRSFIRAPRMTSTRTATPLLRMPPFQC